MGLDEIIDLENGKTAFEIVMQCRMSGRPEFYSGRGATSRDLSSDKLESIYGRIEKHPGKKAAEDFARMVADIPVLSATDFLLSLYRLEANGWAWDKRLLGRENGLYARMPGEALGTIVSALGGFLDRDDTVGIRYEFLKKHSLKDPKMRTYGYF